MKQTLMSIVAAVAAVVAVPAHAIAIAPGVDLTFVYANPNANGQNDNSGKTSARLTSSMYNSSGQLRLESGYFIETFDAGTAMVQGAANGGEGTTLAGSLSTNTVSGINVRNSGCAFNSYGALGGVTVAGGGISLLNQSIPNQAAAPAGDSSCYGAAPQPGNGTDGSVVVSYANLLTGNDFINYFGIYYGSIDTYNDLYFYSSTDATGTAVATVTGSSILALLRGAAGNQLSDTSNVYVNLDFSDAVGFRSFKFVTTGIAVEVDNLVVGLASRQVPEPASLALLGAGFAAMTLVLGRRRRTVVL